MDYHDLYATLKASVTYDAPRIDLDADVSVFNIPFRSASDTLLPDQARYTCPTHGCVFDRESEGDAGEAALDFVPRLNESRVPENREFIYQVFAPAGRERIREVILLLHGFNEKQWHKYLPWAHRLVTATGRAVALFPISFHMNRAPLAWSDRRLMFRAAQERQRRFPLIVASTLSNAAISTRLQVRPERFIWAGLQSYHDVVQVVEQIAGGTHPLIAPDARIDVFGYSIGCLLAQILLMTDPAGRFHRTRLFMFCGGAVFNRMSPVSRFILDSECNVALYSYLVEHLEMHMRANERLRHFLGPEHPEGMSFRSMLNSVAFREERERQFRRIGRRLMGVALDKDTVVPAGEIMNAVQGVRRDLPARVEVLDFDHPYSHEDPFPASASIRCDVDRAFARVFDLAASFYSAPEGD